MRAGPEEQRNKDIPSHRLQPRANPDSLLCLRTSVPSIYPSILEMDVQVLKNV